METCRLFCVHIPVFKYFFINSLIKFIKVYHIFMYMEKNKNTFDTPISYVIPSINDDLRTFAIKYKIDMMEHIINSIGYAIENKLSIAEIFKFKDSNFVITVSESEFSSNIDSIYKFYMEDEIYELCPRLIKLQNILKK